MRAARHTRLADLQCHGFCRSKAVCYAQEGEDERNR
jgi:hypothetical protein